MIIVILVILVTVVVVRIYVLAVGIVGRTRIPVFARGTWLSGRSRHDAGCDGEEGNHRQLHVG
jgi:hypothetical protein